MAALLLAGDVGGTKTDLGLYEVSKAGRLHLVRSATYPSRAHAHLDAILAQFLDDSPPLAAAAFGVAGPILDGVVDVTNLPWHISADALAHQFGCPVRLLNDLEAVAFATLDLAGDDVEDLQPGIAREGHRCVIAAGTGLGQALIPWDGSSYHPCATEGGHADFAPRDDTEIALLRYLRRSHARVSWERILSGAGLHALFRFVAEELGVAVDPQMQARLQRDDPGKVIGEAALAGDCLVSMRAVELFVSLYGAQAGNLALTSMAVGGVYLAGGMVLRLLPAFRSGVFVRSFCAKEPFAELLEAMPVRVICNGSAARDGAARAAAQLARVD